MVVDAAAGFGLCALVSVSAYRKETDGSQNQCCVKQDGAVLKFEAA